MQCLRDNHEMAQQYKYLWRGIVSFVGFQVFNGLSKSLSIPFINLPFNTKTSNHCSAGILRAFSYSQMSYYKLVVKLNNMNERALRNDRPLHLYTFAFCIKISVPPSPKIISGIVTSTHYVIFNYYKFDKPIFDNVIVLHLSYCSSFRSATTSLGFSLCFARARIWTTKWTDLTLRTTVMCVTNGTSGSQRFVTFSC